MIEPPLAAALARVAERASDVLHGYSSGFEPRSTDVLRRFPAVVPNASPLSVAAPADAYFVVEHNGTRAFTRDGVFHFENGELRSEMGWPVLGHSLNVGRSDPVPLRLDAPDAAVRPPRDLRIDPDGTVTFVQVSFDPHSGARRQQRVALGRLSLARFPAGTTPVGLDATHVIAPRGVGVTTGFPGGGAFGALRVSVRELGRVDLEIGLRRLQEAYLSLEALQAAYRGNADVEKGAMDLLK